MFLKLLVEIVTIENYRKMEYTFKNQSLGSATLYKQKLEILSRRSAIVAVRAKNPGSLQLATSPRLGMQ